MIGKWKTGGTRKATLLSNSFSRYNRHCNSSQRNLMVYGVVTGTSVRKLLWLVLLLVF